MVRVSSVNDALPTTTPCLTKYPAYFYDNFGKCGPIFVDFTVNIWTAEDAGTKILFASPQSVATCKCANVLRNFSVQLYNFASILAKIMCLTSGSISYRSYYLVIYFFSWRMHHWDVLFATWGCPGLDGNPSLPVRNPLPIALHDP